MIKIIGAEQEQELEEKKIAPELKKKTIRKGPAKSNKLIIYIITDYFY